MKEVGNIKFELLEGLFHSLMYGMIKGNRDFFERLNKSETAHAFHIICNTKEEVQVVDHILDKHYEFFKESLNLKGGVKNE